MRYIGPYHPAAVPTVDQIVAACSCTHRAALTPLVQVMRTSQAAFAATVPDVHKLVPASLHHGAEEVLKAAYIGRSTALRRLLEEMAKSLPSEHASLCPYCSLDTGPELDHYLPQATFPELSLTPWNLVPICGPCNRRKGTSVANAAGERLFIFPLQGTAPASDLLRASLSFQGAAHAKYFLSRPPGLGDEEFSLAERHFARLGLAERYSKRANGLLSSLRSNLQRAAPSVARRSINGGCTDALSSEPVNGWRRALYAALGRQMVPALAWIAGRPAAPGTAAPGMKAGPGAGSADGYRWQAGPPRWKVRR